MRTYSMQLALMLILLDPVALHAQEEPGPSAASDPPPAVSPGGISRSLGMYVVPKSEQSAEQRDLDELECFDWASNETGIDPDSPAVVAEVKKKRGGALKGAAAGAAVGAAAGAAADADHPVMSDNSGAASGAAAGAVVGAVGGRVKQRRDNRAAQEQAVADAEASREQQRQEFRRAFSVCMRARDYEVD